MAIVLRTLDANAALATLIDDVRYNESFGLRLISLAAGELGGRRASLVTFRQGGAAAPDKPLVLEVVDGALDQAAQQALLTAPGRECVCYGTLYVGGAQRNVAAYR